MQHMYAVGKAPHFSPEPARRQAATTHRPRRKHAPQTRRGRTATGNTNCCINTATSSCRHTHIQVAQQNWPGRTGGLLSIQLTLTSNTPLTESPKTNVSASAVALNVVKPCRASYQKNTCWCHHFCTHVSPKSLLPSAPHLNDVHPKHQQIQRDECKVHQHAEACLQTVDDAVSVLHARSA